MPKFSSFLCPKVRRKNTMINSLFHWTQESVYLVHKAVWPKSVVCEIQYIFVLTLMSPYCGWEGNSEASLQKTMTYKSHTAFLSAADSIAKSDKYIKYPYSICVYSISFHCVRRRVCVHVLTHQEMTNACHRKPAVCASIKLYWYLLYKWKWRYIADDWGRLVVW